MARALNLVCCGKYFRRSMNIWAGENHSCVEQVIRSARADVRQFKGRKMNQLSLLYHVSQWDQCCQLRTRAFARLSRQLFLVFGLDCRTSSSLVKWQRCHRPPSLSCWWTQGPVSVCGAQLAAPGAADTSSSPPLIIASEPRLWPTLPAS